MGAFQGARFYREKVRAQLVQGLLSAVGDFIFREHGCCKRKERRWGQQVGVPPLQVQIVKGRRVAAHRLLKHFPVGSNPQLRYDFELARGPVIGSDLLDAQVFFKCVPANRANHFIFFCREPADDFVGRKRRRLGL